VQGIKAVYAIKDTFPLFVLAVIAVMLGDHFENTVNSFGQSAEGKVCSTPLSAQQCPYVHNLESLKILRFFFQPLLFMPPKGTLGETGFKAELSAYITLQNLHPR